MTRTLNLVAFVVFASSLFMRSTDPVIPQIASGLSVDVSSAALLATAFTLPYALIQPALGALADTMNKARLMLLCMFVLAAASIGSALAVNFEMLVIARVIAGLAAGGVVPIAFAIVGDLVPVAQRQVAMGRLLFAIMTGNLLGATLAGVVGDLAGWRAVFFCVGAVGAIVLVVAIPAFRRTTEAPKAFDLSTLGPNYRTIFSNPLAKICFGAVFLEAVFMYGVFPYIATLLHEAGETRASIAGMVIAGFGIGGALYGLTISRILPWAGETLLMRAGGIIMGACLIVISLRLPWQVEFVNFLVLGFGFYFLHAVIQIYASELAPAARGTALALHSFFFFLGHAAGPIVYGVGLATVGITPVLYVGAIVLAAVGLICAHWLRRHPV
ncbi:MAG: MFS transporter [Pseudolabrys sp.]|nr:MFS transporter [Pseudolabrys sp.]MDP2296482.1 MFS transporter [Pseudolabrys sp.]